VGYFVLVVQIRELQGFSWDWRVFDSISFYISLLFNRRSKPWNTVWTTQKRPFKRLPLISSFIFLNNDFQFNYIQLISNFKIIMSLLFELLCKPCYLLILDGFTFALDFGPYFCYYFWRLLVFNVAMDCGPYFCKDCS